MLESIKTRTSPERPRAKASRFRDDLLQGLATTPKTVPGHYRIDARGSALLEMMLATCDEAPDRWEMALLEEHGAEISQIAGPGVDIVEIGGLSSARARLLLRRLQQPRSYITVDSGHEGVAAAVSALARDHTTLCVIPLRADPGRLTWLPEAVRHGPCTIFFIPGAVFSSMPAAEALRVCKHLAALVEHPHFLVGVGLSKNAAELEKGYDDLSGYVAAFNLNVLARANRELDADFDLTRFRHRSRWNETRSCVELSLESVGAQRAHIGTQTIAFAPRESILVDRIYKLGAPDLQSLARAAGFLPLCCWIDDGGNYALQLFVQSAS